MDKKSMPSKNSIFDSVFFKKPQFSRFNLSYEKKLTFDQGKMIPLGWFELRPNSYVELGIQGIVRLQALVAPIFQNIDARVRFYAVKLSSIYNNDDLMRVFTGGQSGQDFVTMPKVACNPTKMKVGTLYDYLDLPLPYNYAYGQVEFIGDRVTNFPMVGISPFLAYHRIFNDFYRNEEVDLPINEDSYIGNISSDSQSYVKKLSFNTPFRYFGFDRPDNYGLDSLSFIDYQKNDLYALDTLHNVYWQRDYFTSALSNTQRGSQVSLSLSGNADVFPNVSGDTTLLGTSSTVSYNKDSKELTVTDSSSLVRPVSLTADLSNISAVEIIALREAMDLQAFLEKDNLSGYRLCEHIYSHFGIKSDDYYSNKAIYLGGVQFPIEIDPIAQTSASTESSAQGNLAGIGKGFVNKPLLARFHAKEDTIIIPILTLLPKSSYITQGLEKRWQRFSRFDFAYPEFQDIGEEAIKNQELFYSWYAPESVNEGTFGYQYRYSDYKFNFDRVNGDFRTNLSFWHSARVFDSAPSLNKDFLEANPTDRIFAVEDGVTDQHFLGYFNIIVDGILPLKKFPSHKIF